MYTCMIIYLHICSVQSHVYFSHSHVTHMYTHGEVCDLTGKARQCRVRFMYVEKQTSHHFLYVHEWDFKNTINADLIIFFFRCLQNAKPSQVTISLQEPIPCSYIMTVSGLTFLQTSSPSSSLELLFLDCPSLPSLPLSQVWCCYCPVLYLHTDWSRFHLLTTGTHWRVWNIQTASRHIQAQQTIIN